MGIGSDLTLFGLTLFDLFDFLTAKIMLPGGGLLIALFAGWYLDKKIIWEELSNKGTLTVRTYRLLLFGLKYVAPIGISLVFLDQLNVFALFR